MSTPIRLGNGGMKAHGGRFAMCNSEVWKDIDGAPGYQVSSHGRVRSFKKHGGTNGWHIANTPQRILKPGLDRGYPFVYIRGYPVLHIHRLVAEAFLGPCPEGMEVCHNDDTRSNNHIDNLRYDTHASNMEQAARTGGQLRGKDPAFIQAVRERAADGESYASLASDTGVRKSVIRNMCIGLTCKDIPGPIIEPVTDRPQRSTKLTYSDADDIRARHLSGVTQTKLAIEYSVSLSYINRIVHFRRLVRSQD